MKKFLKLFTIIVISTFIFTSNVKATPANTAFKDDEFYACIIRNLNSDKINDVTDRTTEYKVTDDELSQLTSLTCTPLVYKNDISLGGVAGPQISDVTGLNKMTNLTKLNLTNNKLLTIDVSKNTKLAVLDISGNNLSSIDLSKNVELTHLSINNNKLSTIDISKSTKLTELYANNNNLSSMK